MTKAVLQKRWICLFFLSLMFCLTVCISGTDVLAADQLLFDEAGLFSDTQRADLEEQLQALSEKMGMDTVVLTIDDDLGKTSQDYADDFYDNNGFSASGFLFLLNMDYREIYISTAGDAIALYTDERIQSLLDAAYEYMTEGDYADAVSAFLERAEFYYDQGLVPDDFPGEAEHPGTYPSEQSNPFISAFQSNWPLYLGISLIGAGIAILIMLSRNRGVSAVTPSTYHDAQDFDLFMHTDRFLHTTTTRTRISHDPPAGGGSSGRRSGGSRTHTSSSGTRHGGGGRRF